MDEQEKQLAKIRRLSIFLGLGIIILAAQSLATGQEIFLTYAGVLGAFALIWVTILIVKVVKGKDQ